MIHMRTYNVGVLCLQETRISHTQVFEEQGFLIVLSGPCDGSRCWAGVGFIVAPRYRRRIRSYRLISDRIAAMKLRVANGTLGILTSYAPHNLKPLSERFDFYVQLDDAYRKCSANAGRFIFGDLNARIGERRSGEEDVVGEFSYGREAVHVVDVPNRDLLLEACHGLNCVVANTFVQAAPEEKVTFMESGAAPLGPVTLEKYNVLDLILCRSDSLALIEDIRSVRQAALGTDHYLVKCTLEVLEAARNTASKPPVRQRDALKQPDIRETFTRAFGLATIDVDMQDISLEAMWQTSLVALKAAETSLPERRRTSNQPWIQDATMQLIDRRKIARSSNAHEEEKRLHKEIRRMARKDRTEWIDRMLANGSWEQIKKIRQPKKVQHGRLRDRRNELVESDKWSDTMAEYLESVQWQVRPPGLTDGPLLGTKLPVRLDDFGEEEVAVVVKKLAKMKAAGPDGIPAEYWQALARDPHGLTWITELCNKCWRNERIPEAWHQAEVVAIHKKGAVDNCENFRPISLLCVTYKIYASLLLKRLQDAGAESRITPSQFGFRRGVGTRDAIFVARRWVETAWARRSSNLSLLALDWKKCFDSINPDALIAGLGRFGLPARILKVIQNIYSDKRFRVKDSHGMSAETVQSSGISQGCPLSPFLFVLLMTVVVHDAVGQLGEDDQRLHQRGKLATLLYADDTLLAGESGPPLQRLLDAISRTGAAYGMELHWKKFQLLQIRSGYDIKTPNGESIEATKTLAYLGSTIREDGTIKQEICRRLGAAWADFSKLARLWKHASLTRSRKVQVFQSLVTSRILYGLSSAWINISETRRIDGFQVRCLRQILGIKPSYWSRVSNATVLQQAGQPAYSKQLLRQQLLLYGQVARAPDGDPLKSCTFCPGSLRPATDRYVRRVGRPRNEWASMLQKEALKLTNGHLEKTILCKSTWERMVQHHIG